MEALSTLQNLAGEVDADLMLALKKGESPRTKRLYDMLGYFFGFRNENLEEIEADAGKRFRPVLCLALAEGYGARERALPAALSIELFHNFTLIHDDIADHDEIRRNRPTLWKLFGVDHALNAGDALSLLSLEMAMSTGERALTDALVRAFREVIEGQYLDFEGCRGTQITADFSMEITKRKTGALVRVSAETAGIAAGRIEDELILLRVFGESLGIAFQLSDDYRSVWSTIEETGKDAHSDVRERKQTLPYVYARDELGGTDRSRLEELYGLPRSLSESEMSEAIHLMDQTKSREKVRKDIGVHARKAKDAARFLSVPQTLSQTLVTLVDELSERG